MSTATETISDIVGVGFKYLTKSLYTVNFNSNGGSAVAEQTDIPRSSLITEPTPPIKSEYTFSGWYKEDTLTNAWKFDTDTVTDNITLYAKWTSKGGSGNNNSNNNSNNNNNNNNNNSSSGAPSATLLVQGIDKQSGEIIYSKSSSVIVGTTETINALAIEGYHLDTGSKKDGNDNVQSR
ncbi:InlB B-repeat-containing protein [Lysinibacillus sp. MHQ-1]|nr:InlB B-repeat-containing protein [Lysinibacillus sp. MHQ-1]